jgi:hypothetical protein
LRRRAAHAPAEAARHLHQTRDAVLRRRMGGEQAVARAAGERVDDEEMRARGVGLGLVVVDRLRAAADLV